MTVGELKEAIINLPDDARVIVWSHTQMRFAGAVWDTLTATKEVYAKSCVRTEDGSISLQISPKE